MKRLARREPGIVRETLGLIRLAFDRLLLRGLRYRLLLAVGIVVLIALIAGTLVVLLDPDLSDFDEGVWWAFLRLTDPGYLGDDEGITRRAISGERVCLPHAARPAARRRPKPGGVRRAS